MVNFPFIYSNIPAAPAYGVYISQLIRYSAACGSYHRYLDGLIFIILYTAKTIRNTIDKIKGTNNELQNTAEN
jgi:hypothetical protein